MTSEREADEKEVMSADFPVCTSPCSMVAALRLRKAGRTKAPLIHERGQALPFITPSQSLTLREENTNSSQFQVQTNLEAPTTQISPGIHHHS